MQVLSGILAVLAIAILGVILLVIAGVSTLATLVAGAFRPRGNSGNQNTRHSSSPTAAQHEPKPGDVEVIMTPAQRAGITGSIDRDEMRERLKQKKSFSGFDGDAEIYS